MKHLNILLIFIILLSAFHASAQKIGVIIGNVKDSNTKEILAGASIKIEGIDAATVSDKNGNYKIIAPVGTYNLNATLIIQSEFSGLDGKLLPSS